MARMSFVRIIAANTRAEYRQVSTHVLFLGQNHINTEHPQLVTGLPGSEIWVYQIKISHLNRFSGLPFRHGKIYGNLGFAAAVIADNNNDVVVVDMFFRV